MSEDRNEIEGREESAHPEWFRGPNRRERWIAAGLFIAFGLFFVGLFWVQKHWWFRWVVLGLGLVSIWRGIRHAIVARAAGP